MVIQNFFNFPLVFLSSSFSSQSSNFSNFSILFPLFRRNIRKKTPKFSFSFVRRNQACLRHRSSLSGCRFGRSGSSGLVGRLLRLRLSDREPVLKDRRNPDWCSYRYICRTGEFLAVNGCRPKRIQLPLRGCLRSRSRVRAFHSHSTSEL